MEVEQLPLGLKWRLKVHILCNLHKVEKLEANVIFSLKNLLLYSNDLK